MTKPISEMDDKPTPNPKTLTILHLTDLHLRTKDSAMKPYEADSQKIWIESLRNTLRSIMESIDKGRDDFDDSWRPDVVVISGDIAFSGKEKEYEYAKEVISDLMGVIGLKPEKHLVVCAGNHDRNLDFTTGMEHPLNADMADEWLRPRVLKKAGNSLVRPFENFKIFCRDKINAPYVSLRRDSSPQASTGIQPDSPANDASSKAPPGKDARENPDKDTQELDYLCGCVDFYFSGKTDQPPTKVDAPKNCSKLSHVKPSGDSPFVRFVVLNSAWFSAKNDFGRLWLGLPILQNLEAEKQFERVNEKSSHSAIDKRPELVISLVHHPKEWFNAQDRDSYSDRPNTYRYLAERCDIILSGHVHGAIEPPTRSYNSAYVFTGGATFDNEHARYRNNFSLLQFDMIGRCISQRSFEYDPRVERWKEETAAKAVFALQSEASRFLTAKSAESIEIHGNWNSVYWFEERGRIRRYPGMLTIELAKEEQVESQLKRLEEWLGDSEIKNEHLVSGAKEILRVALSMKMNVYCGSDHSNPQTKWRYMLYGCLVKRVFTGVWFNQPRTDPKDLRYGTFQFVVSKSEPRSCENGGVASIERALTLDGRWSGFDSEWHVNSGGWRAEWDEKSK